MPAGLVDTSRLVEAASLEIDAVGCPVEAVAFVDLSGEPPSAEVITAAASSGRVLVGVGEELPGPAWSGLVEQLAFSLVSSGAGASRRFVAVEDLEDACDLLRSAVDSAPRAAATLVGLLRLTDTLTVPDGLVAESMAYSTLLAGPEFATWRASRPARGSPEPTSPLIVERREDRLRLTLNRPERHNAFGHALRDALYEALDLPLWDPSISHVVLAGAGRSFCSGGDLDEFGTAPDVSSAHLVRTQRSVGARLHALRDRVEARVHGACIGAGVELPAFCGTVIAHPDSFFSLPELSLGLVPGAGGTVSLTKRIGRWRTAFLALTGHRLDAFTALDWGLVDRVVS